MSKKVLVTGANGHLGNTLTKMLVDDGYDVRVTVRRPEEVKQSGIFDGYDIEIFKADIRDGKAMEEAMQGVDGVFQTAALYNYDDQSVGENIVDNNTEGGLAVLQAASNQGVKKVILTSSIVAIGFGGANGIPMNEESWSDPQDPYCLSKMKSEKAAWEFAQSNGINLVTICPGLLLGPNFYTHTPSTINVSSMLSNQIPFRLSQSTTIVDVRDVARAHILAYEETKASGRYLVSGHHVEDFYSALSEVVPDLEPPERLLLMEEAREFAIKSNAMPVEMLGHSFLFTDEKISSDLGWKPRPLEETLKDTVSWIEEVVD